ncbi:rhamnulokinase, partial [Candidatus Sumerlaeota bacterium]|nr:rhamnulokinase [Candidatus Sumerlaeota bacterium]
IVQECRRLWAREGHHYSYDDLAEMAARARPFCAFIDPNDPCFLNPADMPAAIVHFCERTGQQPPQTHGEFVRCALESIALRYRDVLGKIGQISSRKIAVLHIVGGGSRNRLLNQFTADATGVTVVAGPDEATALGNVLMQAIASGDLSSVEEGRAVVRSSAQLEIFEPREPDRWAEAWQRYCHFVQGQ